MPRHACQQSDEAQEQRQTVEHVVSLVVLQAVGQLALVSQASVVDERNAGNPVSFFQVAIALDVVLVSREVPHEVSPVHEVALIGQEEADVLQLGGNLHRDRLSAAVVGHIRTVHATHPVFIGLRVGTTVHAWEEHILGIYVFIFVRNDEIRILLVGIFLFLTSVDGCSFFADGLAHIAFLGQFNLSGIGLSVKQRTVAILITA